MKVYRCWLYNGVGCITDEKQWLKKLPPIKMYQKT